MSQANAAAIKRRANPGTVSLTSQNNTTNSSKQMAPPLSAGSPNVNNPGLTLPQVIALVDKRLIHLESHIKDTSLQQATTGVESEVFEKVLESMTNEINHRFEIFAGEIANLKDIVLKLQSYTMEVNKALLSESLGEKAKEGGSIEVESKNISTSIDLRELVEEELVPENNIVFADS